MAKRVGGFVINNQMFKEKWAKLLAIQKETSIPEGPQVEGVPDTEGTGGRTKPDAGANAAADRP